MIIQIKDTADEIYHINPANIVYLKQTSHNHGLWKIVLVTDERIITRDKSQIYNIINFLKDEKNIQELVRA
jgi:ABC-type molybdate transport system substrate-binding protein